VRRSVGHRIDFSRRSGGRSEKPVPRRFVRREEGDRPNFLRPKFFHRIAVGGDGTGDAAGQCGPSGLGRYWLCRSRRKHVRAWRRRAPSRGRRWRRIRHWPRRMSRKTAAAEAGVVAVDHPERYAHGGRAASMALPPFFQDLEPGAGSDGAHRGGRRRGCHGPRSRRSHRTASQRRASTGLMHQGRDAHGFVRRWRASGWKRSNHDLQPRRFARDGGLEMMTRPLPEAGPWDDGGEYLSWRRRDCRAPRVSVAEEGEWFIRCEIGADRRA